MVQQQLEAPSGSQSGGGLPQQAQPGQAPEQAEQMAAQEERLQEAEKLRKQALTEFSYNQKILTGLMTKADKSTPSTAMLKPLRSSVKDSIKTIEQLRRLFFSLIEHLRETTQKQVELGDETRDVVTLAKTATDAETAARMGPLSSRQGTLSTVTGAIAEALSKESQQMAQQPPNQGGSGDSGQMVEKYLQAGQLVGEATVKMYGVASMMTEEKIPLEEIGPQQKAASEDLIRALALLQPPQPEPQQDQQQKQKKSQQHEQQKDDEPQQQDVDRRSDGDMNQMLQGVRDREAQRRQDQQERQKQSAGYQPVEKDW